MRWARDASVQYIILFVLSTENWNRSKEELSYLMDLLTSVLTEEVSVLTKEGVRIRIIGERKKFSKRLQKHMREAEALTAENEKLALGLCLSYGGRAEILDAARRMAEEEGEFTEAAFEKRLWTNGFPDPDFIIRTSGEMRLSGFLPWQSVYSELFFTKTLWPDFSEEEFKAILKEFVQRDRRMGR